MRVVELEAIEFTYPGGLPILRGASLAIEAGSSVALVGRNGAGKTTLLKMANGLLRPSSGVVRLFGDDIRDVSTAQISHKVGFVFQDPRAQIFLSTVAEEVAFGPRRVGMSDEEIQRRVSIALELTGLTPYRTSHPYDLAPSERKLLAIASIISMNPQILILDEPTGGMDAAATDTVIRVIDAHLVEGKTVVAASHDMEFVARCFARMAILHEGRIVADGLTHQIFSQHELLASVSLEPTAIGLLAAQCKLPRTLLTVPEMADYLLGKR